MFILMPFRPDTVDVAGALAAANNNPSTRYGVAMALQSKVLDIIAFLESVYAGAVQDKFTDVDGNQHGPQLWDNNGVEYFPETGKADNGDKTYTLQDVIAGLNFYRNQLGLLKDFLAFYRDEEKSVKKQGQETQDLGKPSGG